MSKWHTTEFCENCYKEFCCTSECKNHLLHRIKQAREEIENEVKFWSESSKCGIKEVDEKKEAKACSYKHCLEILDKLLEEAEKNKKAEPLPSVFGNADTKGPFEGLEVEEEEIEEDLER